MKKSGLMERINKQADRRVEEARSVLDGVLRAASSLHADCRTFKVGYRLDGRVALDDEDLGIVHVGIGEGHDLPPLVRDGEAVPDAVYVSGRELLLLRVPVDRLAYELDAQTRAHFPCDVDVEAYDLSVLIPVAHGREGVVEAEDEGAPVQNVLE